MRIHPKMQNKSKNIQNRNTVENPNKSGMIILLSLALWSMICVGFYYYSVKAHILWAVHLYMLVAIPALAAAVIINAYFNARYAKDSDKKPDETLVKKARVAVKTLIIVGLPPLCCVIIDYIVIWITERF